MIETPKFVLSARSAGGLPIMEGMTPRSHKVSDDIKTPGRWKGKIWADSKRNEQLIT